MRGILIHGSQKSTCYIWLPINSRGGLLPMLSLLRGRFLLPKGTVLPFHSQNPHALLENVDCRIRIATNLYSTARAGMSSGTQWLLRPMSTIRTILRRIVTAILIMAKALCRKQKQAFILQKWDTVRRSLSQNSSDDTQRETKIAFQL